MAVARASSVLRGINPPAAPRPVGSYVQAMVHKDTVYTTLALAFDPATMKLVEGPVDVQIRQLFSNVQAILEGSGSSLDRIIKQTIYLTDMSDSPVFNEVTAELLKDHKPARATFQVAGLPLGARLAMDVIAAVNEEAPKM